MRVALVSEHASPLAALGGADAGGQNVHVAALASELARLGADVVVYTRRDDPTLAERVRLGTRLVVEHIDAGPPRPVAKDHLLPYMDAFADGLRSAWSTWRPDVAHSHFWMSGQATLAAAAELGVPVAHTFHALGVVKRRHQGPDDTSPAARVGVERQVAQGVDRVIATCNDEALELASMGADLARVQVVPCGVDVAHFDPEGPGEPSSRPRVLAVGRLVPRKGLDDAVAALVHVPEAELVVAGGPDAADLGDDAEAQRLLRVADDIGVADRVQLWGRVDQRRLPRLYRSADVVLCLPWYEPFGIVPLEAMACGVPVVASAVGGLCDTVVDGVTGIHVPPRSPAVAGAAVRRLLFDVGLRQRMGQASVRRVRQRYSWPGVARSNLAVYRELRRTAVTATASAGGQQ